MPSNSRPPEAPRRAASREAAVRQVRLRAPGVEAAPELDAQQRRVVAHEGSPMLVLAGPGSGKTTTIVEAVVARLSGQHALPSSAVLVLTFGRSAAAELRSRITARLAGVASPVVATFHSLAWSLLSMYAEPDEQPAMLLSGPDQDLMIRQLLEFPDPVWAQHWPAQTREVLGAGAMAGELATFMAAARAHGWDPADVTGAALNGPTSGAVFEQAPVPREWSAVGAFFEHYLQLLDLRGAVDYAEAIHRARLLAERKPDIGAQFQAIYIDEYQDTDPAQVALVRALAAPDATVVAVGDPDQAIYRFRGADVSGILDFPDQFTTPSGDPAPVVVLDRTRRFGPEIRAVAERWIAPVSMGTLPASQRVAHRNPHCDGPPGRIELLTSGSHEEQAAAIADLLRRARFDESEPLGWSQMAVLVRSGVADIPRLQRALLQAGVPVEVPPGEVPLGHDPVLAPLLTGLRLAVEPTEVSASAIEEYLRSPLVGLTALEVRRVRQALRSQEQVLAQELAVLPRNSAQLLQAVVAGEMALPELADPRLERRCARVLEVLTAVRAPGLTIPERLWLLWCDGGNVPGRWANALEEQSFRGGIEGQRADVALDSVVELFRVAQRMPKGSGVGLFLDTLENQQMVAARSEALGFTRDCVRLLTAHRAKGLQWPLVVVVGLQQDLWPAARNPATLLAADRIGSDGVAVGRTRNELIEDERRLAYVAATRARERLILAAVDTGMDGEAPSELFREAMDVLGPQAQLRIPPAPRSRLTPASVVASLREALADPDSSDALRNAAAARLAALAVDTGNGALAPQADPARWWGRLALTESETPLVAPDQPVALSATALESLGECSMRWFLQRRMHSDSARGASLAIGRLVHSAVQAVVEGRLPADEEAIMAALEVVWPGLPIAATWEAEAKLRDTREQVVRFLNWWREQPHGEYRAEAEFTYPVDGLEHGPVELRGLIDLVAPATEGAAHVVDFKTGTQVLSLADAETSLQLGTYQLAVREEGEVPAGGTLVYLGKGIGAGGAQPTLRSQAPLTDETWIRDAIEDAAAALREERIVARANDSCRTCTMRPMCPVVAETDWIAGAHPQDSGDSAEGGGGA